jgi:hypothetical protein
MEKLKVAEAQARAAAIEAERVRLGVQGDVQDPTTAPQLEGRILPRPEAVATTSPTPAPS